MDHKVQRPEDLHAFMMAAGCEMQREYERIQRSSKDDPGTAGDQGEENWRELLSQWLPPYYRVVTKGRILSNLGEASPQVDVVVLHPTYPRKLEKMKQYLAGGVVAAFECKVTLDSGHIGEAMECAKKIRRLLPKRYGTPYKELNSPLLFGLLAHSHSWKSPGSDPQRNISNALFEKDRAIVEHPTEMLDILCVADVGTWVADKEPYWGPRALPESQPDRDMAALLNAQVGQAFGSAGCVMTGYMGHHNRDVNTGVEYAPVSACLTYLFRKLAWEDSALRRLATYFEFSQITGGANSQGRLWPTSIYSADVREKLGLWRRPNWGWDEWAAQQM